MTIGEDNKVFENLKQAIEAIPNGGSGVIAVAGGIWNGTENIGIYISNKFVTIMPKPEIMPKPIDALDDEPVIFSGEREVYFLSLDSAQLIMDDINITGNFTVQALKFSNCMECYISDCTFENIGYIISLGPISVRPGTPIDADGTTIVLDGCTFESNSASFSETVL